MSQKPASLTKETLEEIVKSTNIAKTMNECLWVGDREHKTIYINPVFEKISGYSLEEALGKDCKFFFDEEGKKEIEKHHKLRRLGRASQYEANILSKNGKRIPLLISGSTTKAGGTLGIFTNLSKLKKLANQEKVASQIIKNSAEAIVTLNKNRHITMWNTGAKKIFGYKEKEVLNKSIEIIIPESEMEENKKIRSTVQDKKFIKNFETTRYTKNGDLIDVSLSVTKVTDEKNNLIGYLLIYRDITERKRFNTELQKRFETIQDAYRELGLQKRQADYIYEIVSAATGNTSLEALEKLIVSAITMLTKSDAAILRLTDKKRQNLILKSSIGVNEKWIAKSKVQLAGSLAETAFYNGRSIIVNSVDSSQRHRSTNLVKSHGFKTLILIPLVFEGKLIGSLSLYSKNANKFRLIETDFVENFSRQCTLALYAKC